jgi:hypothetical protein
MHCPYENLIKPTMQFCENNLCSFISAPANTWSNLAFIFVGIYLIFVSRKKNNFLLKLFGPIAILCGLSSLIYHATFSYFWQIFDNLAMFFFASLLIIFNLFRFKTKNFSVKNWVFFYVLLNIFSFIIFYYQKTFLGINVGIIIFIFQILIILFTEFLLYKKYKNEYKLNNLLIAFAILLTAWGIWWLDFLKIWCDPATLHIINGHAIWHVLNSLSFIFVYKFYKQFSV